MNPYSGTDFFQFFILFFQRLFSGSMHPLAIDEIQIFVLVLVSIASALIGTLLVLKRMTMLANSLSHTILLGIVISYLIVSSATGGMFINFKILIIAALITGIITTLLTQFLNHVVKLQEDASIGLVFTSLFALGILLVTIYTRNAHIGLEVVMGNADALHFNDLKVVGAVALVNLIVVTLFFKEWKLITFDSSLASILGFSPTLFSYFLMLLTSATAISAFRAVGVILFLAFLVGPPLAARLMTHNLRSILILASLIGMGCSLVGVALSRHLFTVYHMPLSTAGLVVTLIGISFLISIAIRSLTLRKISP